MSQKYLNSSQAAAALGVKLPTLYAYVSRGLLRSRPGDDPRERLYPEQDVVALAARREARRDPSKTVRSALDFGAPIRRSELTLIDRGRFYYRGRDAVGLARSSSIEAVAALLWTGDESAAKELFPDTTTITSVQPPPSTRLPAQALRLPAAERLSVALRLAKNNDPAGSDLRPARAVLCGARILALLVTTAAATEAKQARAQGRPGQSLATTLQKAWAPRKPAAARAIDCALVLCADHELNVSSFTARCVASAGATPYDVVAAGLAALSGYRHGGHSDRVEAFFDELGIGPGQRRQPSPRALRDRLAARLERGERIPGFGQRLYPQGDPRFPALLEQMKESWPGSPMLAAIEETTQETSRLIDEHPTIDVGLASLSKLLGLPSGGARTIFSLGRTVGWIAHAIEEYERGELIRPRARYTGPLPEAASDGGVR